MTIAEGILVLITAYATVGGIFGLLFVLRGAARIDHAAAGAPWSFRLLILPGAAALWPLLLAKWIRAAKSRSPGATL